MPHMISRIRLAIKNIAKKVRWTRKTLSFSRNKASRGAGASSDGLFQNPGLSMLPAEPLFIHCYPNVFPDLCYCHECVQYCRAAAQLLPDERYVDYDLAQVSVGLPPQPPPSAFIDVSIPTSPSVMSLPNPRAARTDEELFADIDQWCSKWGFLPESDPLVPNGERQVEALSTALESSEPVIATFAESPPTLSVSIMSPPNLYARTDEQMYADINKLFCDIEQWYTKHGFLPEDPVPSAGERPEALVSTVSERPIIITFAESQPTLSAIMYQDFYGLLPPYRLYSDTVAKLRWEEEEPYATGMGRVLEAPAAFGCSDEDEDDSDEDDSSLETVTPHRLSLIKGAGEVTGYRANLYGWPVGL